MENPLWCGDEFVVANDSPYYRAVLHGCKNHLMLPFAAYCCCSCVCRAFHSASTWRIFAASICLYQSLAPLRSVLWPVTWPCFIPCSYPCVFVTQHDSALFCARSVWRSSPWWSVVSAL